MKTDTKKTKEKKPARIAKQDGEKKPIKEVKEEKLARTSEKGGKKVKSHPLIIGTRITEKSALQADKNVYTFNVIDSANKSELIKAIKLVYGVIPVRINITQRKEKKVFIRGKKGVKAGGKKAVVYLKKGDKIEFV